MRSILSLVQLVRSVKFKSVIQDICKIAKGWNISSTEQKISKDGHIGKSFRSFHQLGRQLTWAKCAHILDNRGDLAMINYKILKCVTLIKKVKIKFISRVISGDMSQQCTFQDFIGWFSHFDFNSDSKAEIMNWPCSSKKI